MDNNHRKLLRENRVTFVRDLLCSEELLAVLQMNNTLTSEMADEVRVEKTKGRKASALLDILPRRGPRAFSTFLEALMESGQDFLCEMLDPNFAREFRATHPATQPPQRPYIPPSQPARPPPVRAQSYERSALPKFEDPMAEESSFMSINIQNVDIGSPHIQSLIARQDVYQMAHRPRGRAVIICNKYFIDRRLTEREGAEFDLVNLDTLFRGLGFESVQYEDKTGQQMADLLIQESRHPAHKNADAFILFLMTHGARGAVYGIDGKSIKVDEQIAACFDAMNCPALKDKPKMIFIQACQGQALSQGIPQSDAAANDESDEIDLIKKLKELSIQDNPDSVPSFASSTHEKSDFVMAYSTVPGYRSWRRADLGSWFVRALCQVFSTYAHEEHLTEMLTKVRNIVAEQKTVFTADSHYIQVTETRDTLRKKIYFFPGLMYEVEMRKDICDK